ncbi:MAG: metallophosphoesterase family protein [Candidatus Omnitrophica bacterium]|nr:metallophosphoesterase family protein [Candidatus Omnitrophota bacterium]
MKIGVISDTHIPLCAAKLPKIITDSFQDCDLIIHAGDICELSVIKELSKLAETKAVHGNMDSHEVKSTLPEKLLLVIAGKKIGVVHGKGIAFNVIKYVSKSFNKKPDIIIFGHSHTPVNEQKDGTLFFNPGSPTDRVFTKYRSFGIIEIDGDKITAKIIKIDE